MRTAFRNALCAATVLFILSGCTIFSVGPFVLEYRGDPTPVPATLPSPTPDAPPPAATPVISEPYVTANVTVNVRSGDSTAYEILGSLPAGGSAPLLGISSTGSGWFYVSLPSGMPGFVSFELVTVTGDVSALQSMVPPTLPTSNYNLTLTGYIFDSPEYRAVCDADTPITFTVTNNSDGISLTTTGRVQMLTTGGELLSEGFVTIPSIEAGATTSATVGVPMFVRPDGNYQLVVTVDINDVMHESDENDNAKGNFFLLACGSEEE